MVFIPRTKALALLLALSVISAAPAEMTTEVDYKQLGYRDQCFTLADEPYTGVAVKKDKQGRIRGRYVYADGVLNGVAEEWYTNGVKSVETAFVRNERHGTNTYWNLDGSLLKRQVWREGKLLESTDPHDLPTAP